MSETTGRDASTETMETGDAQRMEGRRGPTWRQWALSILAAIVLSVTATLLLGGYDAFRSDRGGTAGGTGSGAGSPCCPHQAAGK